MSISLLKYNTVLRATTVLVRISHTLAFPPFLLLSLSFLCVWHLAYRTRYELDCHASEIQISIISSAIAKLLVDLCKIFAVMQLIYFKRPFLPQMLYCYTITSRYTYYLPG